MEQKIEILKTKFLSNGLLSKKARIKKYVANVYRRLKSKNFHAYEISFFGGGMYFFKLSKTDLLSEPITADKIIWIICSFVIANSLIGIVVSFAKWLKVVYAK